LVIIENNATIITKDEDFVILSHLQLNKPPIGFILEISVKNHSFNGLRKSYPF